MKLFPATGAVMLVLGVVLVGMGVNAQQDDGADVAAVEVADLPAAEEEAPAEVVPVAADAEPAPMAEALMPAEDPAEIPAAPVVKAEVEAMPAELPAAPEIVVTPDNGEEGFLATPDDTTPIEGATATTNTENLISISLDDVEMVDVVRMFTRISKANIVANPSNLVGRVTVNLENVEWKPALDSILDMHGLAIIEKRPNSGVYSIIHRPPGTPDPLVVETFFLSYATVAHVSAVVSSMLAPQGKMSPFPARNALVVRSTDANMAEIKQIIKTIDKLREQVFIEAKFMELSDKAIKDLGINWQVLQAYTVSAGNLQWDLTENRDWTEGRSDAYRQYDNRSQYDNRFHSYDMNEVEAAGISAPSMSSIGGVSPQHEVGDTIERGVDQSTTIYDTFDKTVADVRTAVLGVDDFKLVLSALKQMNGVSIVSNPKIIVANEEAATIHIGQTERPFVSSVTPGQQGIAPVVTYNPGEPVDTGVKLVVTPTVNTESNITVRITPELTRFQENAIAPNGQTYPIVGTKKINTVFCLESGKTVAIGGLTETADRDVTTKIPLLGDIPLIGKYLFSHTHKEKQQTETIIFVTVGLAMPESIQRDSGLPEDTELTRRHAIRSTARRAEFMTEIERAQRAQEAETDQKLEKARNRLMRRN